MNEEKHYDIDFNDYSFNDMPGTFTYRLRKKRMAKSGNMTLFVDCDNGAKHMITLFPDNNFHGMLSVEPEAVISVEFVCSKNGRIYAKSITVKENA